MQDKVYEERYNNQGYLMGIIKYKEKGFVDVYFPEYDFIRENICDYNYKKGKVLLPFEVIHKNEVSTNKFGSKMIIESINKSSDITVYFPEYNWRCEHTRYSSFKGGSIICPYEKRFYGKGYAGEGEFKIKVNNKATEVYNIWHHMMERCYSENYHKKRPTYIDCSCEEFHCLQDFGKWYKENFYQVPGELMCLDKDILCKGNKIYSPSTCIFVPKRINSLFIKCDAARGDLPIGVTRWKNKFHPQCCGVKHMGYFDTVEDAFEVYKYHKEKYMKEVIDSYEGKIPNYQYKKLHKAIYNWKIEIMD